MKRPKEQKQKVLKGLARRQPFGLFLSLLSLLSLPAWAGFTSSDTITSSSVGTILESGKVYTVPSSVTLTAAAGQSALTAFGTSVIYIPKGVTLTVNGGNASGTTGAGAGICVPWLATLIVTGQGNLVVSGGNAGNGLNGNGGGSGWVNYDNWQGGAGGTGGAGGGGAAAAIGGVGGSGGAGGSGGYNSQDKTTYGGHDSAGADGSPGSSGSQGTSSGTLYVLGTMTLSATGGSSGSGGSGGSNGSHQNDYWTWDFYAGWGGGGGGGGGGGAASYAIGGGGNGGGGGGGGGSGGRFSCATGGGWCGAPDGQGGSGGYSPSSNGSRGSPESRGYGDYLSDGPTYGGWGGSGGSFYSTSGSSGLVYLDSGVTVSATCGTTTDASTHSAIEYTMTFSDYWRLDPSNVTVRLGYALPTGVAPVLSRANYTFNGWYTAQNGGGTKYYDADGTATKTVWDNVGDLTLYASWTIIDSGKAAITVNSAGIVAGVSKVGPDWTYDGETGVLQFNVGGYYAISGLETNGEIRIVAACGGSLDLKGLTLDTSSRPGISPLSFAYAYSGTASPVLNVSGESSLTAGAGANAVAVSGKDNLFVFCDAPLHANGGSGAAAFGGDGLLTIGYGAILATGGASCAADISCATDRIRGGSIRAPNGISSPVNNSGAALYCVTVTNMTANANVSVSGLSGYDTRYIYADAEGKIYLWLPDGYYSFTADSRQWLASVHGAAMTALPRKLYGLTVNGYDIGYRYGEGWEFDGDLTVSLTNAGPLTVSGSPSPAVGLVAEVDCAVTFSNATVDASAIEKAAFLVQNGTTATIALAGTNTLAGGNNRAALECADGTRVRIQGSGSLAAAGGNCAAGIGGGCTGACGAVTIAGGTIAAEGGYGGAGIGGGHTGAGGTISIGAARVTATGGEQAAGVGGGCSGAGGTVTVSGGIVDATGGAGGAGIGGGKSGGSGTISVSGGTVWASGGTLSPADIGRGSDGAAQSGSVTIRGGSVIGYVAGEISPAPVDWQANEVHPFDIDGFAPSNRVTVTITDNDFLATYGKSDIYSDANGLVRLWFSSSKGNPVFITATDEAGTKKNYYIYIYPDGTWARVDGAIFVNDELVRGAATSSGTGWACQNGIVTISADAVVTGQSTNGILRIVAASGTGSLTLDELEIRTKARLASALVVTNAVCDLILKKEIVLAASGDYAAGVEVCSNATLTVKGGGALAATGGRYAAGIGSRGGFPPPGKMVFAGGTIAATGGDQAAGIGGGYNSVPMAGGIAVTGGSIFARGGTSAAGLGSGNAKAPIPDGAVVLSGGTVVAGRGDVYQSGSTQVNGGEYFADLITSGNAQPVSGTSKALVVTGGSIVALNGVVKPVPVDAEGALLCGVVVSNLAAGAAANVAGLDGYGVDDIVAGENGTVCLWLAGSEEGTTYTFTAGGSTWSATIKTSDTGMLFGRTVVPEGVAVSTLSFAGRRMLLTVSSDNPDWLRLNADGLEVRAFTSLGGGGEEEVLPSEATVNADGTATISVSLPEGRNAMFFKVGTGGTDR